MNNAKLSNVIQMEKFSLTPSLEKSNQDAFGYSSNRLSSEQEVHLAVIADGMGGTL